MNSRDGGVMLGAGFITASRAVREAKENRLTEQNHAAQRDQVYDLILAALVISAALSALADEFRAVTAAAALIQLAPFASLAEKINWLTEVPVVGPGLFAPALRWHDSVPLSPLPDIAAQDWHRLQSAAGRGAFVLFGLPLLAAPYLLRDSRPDLKFRRRHSFESLVSAQSRSWPLAGIVRTFASPDGQENPVKAISETQRTETVPRPCGGHLLRPEVPATLPLEMEIALRPEVWLSSRRLARFRPEDGLPPEPERPVIEISEKLSVEAVCEAMEIQLGPPWKGFDGLRPAHRALAAAFALGCGGNEANCGRLLATVSVLAEKSALRGQSLNRAIPRCGKVARQIDRALHGPPGGRLRLIADRHAWLRPAFVGMLLASRLSNGALATASFVWLKREDRTLWYALNAAGNNVAAAEAAGVIAHFRAEKQSRQPLHAPAVSLAAKALVSDYLGLNPEQARIRRLVRNARKPVGQILRESAERRRTGESERC